MQYDENAEKYGYEGEMTPMKCDELKAYKGDVTIPVYGTIADADVYLKKDVDAAIAELKAENERLKKCEIWMMQHFYCEEVIACESAKRRQLQRTLWLSRALRAKECKYKYETWERHEERKVYKDYDMIAIVSRKARMWRRVEIKCLKKAKEYK